MGRSFAFAIACALVLVAGGGCASTKGPEVRVLGVNQKFGPAPRHEVVFVQVTNPAKRPMRLTKLEYTFAAQGATVSTGSVPLYRDVPAGAAVVVEVPLELAIDGPMTLRGKLTAELDQIVRIFTVSAQVQTN
jgi:LEA14-like dessication related protein